MFTPHDFPLCVTLATLTNPNLCYHFGSEAVGIFPIFFMPAATAGWLGILQPCPVTLQALSLNSVPVSFAASTMAVISLEALPLPLHSW